MDEHAEILEGVKRVERLLEGAFTCRRCGETFAANRTQDGGVLACDAQCCHLAGVGTTRYACARCGCEIESHWTHAQAREEYEREFNEEERKYGLPRYVCPLCYYRIVASRPKHHLVPEGELKV